MTIFRAPVCDSDGDDDPKWKLVHTDELDRLEHDHELLLEVARCAERADGVALRAALDELPIDLALGMFVS